MKLPSDAIIAPDKLTHYLLVRQTRGDKSAFLARGGIHTRKHRSTSPRFTFTIAPTRRYAALFDRIWTALRNSWPSRRTKWYDLANPLHLDEREFVSYHQIHYPNSGKI